MNNITPGYKTTEFYITLISTILGALVAGGAIDAAIASNITNTVQAVAMAIQAVAGAYIAIKPLVSYITGRNMLKLGLISAKLAPAATASAVVAQAPSVVAAPSDVASGGQGSAQ